MRPLLLSIVIAVSLGCRGKDAETGGRSGGRSGDRSVAVQLNWYPEAEHGGVYQSAAGELYEAANLQVDIRPGGANTPIAGELQLGRAEFAIENADDVVLQRRRGVDVVAVAAVVQNSPRCILVQSSTGVTDLTGLKGMTLQLQPGRSFIDFLRQRGVLDGVKEVPYLGSVSSLVADPSVAIQGYLFSEPLMARQAGVEVNVLMVSDLGWNPYSSVLVTTGEMIRTRPDVVAQFVDATLSGWRAYLDDPKLGNQAILAANQHGITPEALDYGIEQLRSLALPADGGDGAVGQMSPERWETLVRQMDRLQPSEAGRVKAEDCFTLEFLGRPKEAS